MHELQLTYSPAKSDFRGGTQWIYRWGALVTPNFWDWKSSDGGKIFLEKELGWIKTEWILSVMSLSFILLSLIRRCDLILNLWEPSSGNFLSQISAIWKLAKIFENSP